MTFPDAEKRDFAELVAQQVKESCVGACGLSVEAREEMKHLAGVVKDAGSGNYSVGVECLRKTLNLFSRFDKFAILTVRTMYVSFLIIVFGALCKIFGAGFFEFFKK